MKTITLTLAIMLCSSMVVQAQDTRESCQLEVTIPDRYEKADYMGGKLTYKHEKSRCAIILSKETSAQSELTSLKTAAIMSYDEALSNTSYSNQTIQQREIGAEQFYLVSWEEDFENSSDFYHLVAYTELCGRVYMLELSTDIEDQDKNIDDFLDMLESCSPAYAEL